MIAMKLDVRLDGFTDPIGSLSKDENNALSFAYASTYLDNPSAYPLS
jgi:serine/threonine-protein kinase HipA